MELILVAIALFGPPLSFYVANRISTAINRRRWVEMDAIVKNFRDDNIQHFPHAKQAPADMARLEQRVTDHDKHDDERFERIEAMFREIRDSLRQK